MVPSIPLPISWHLLPPQKHTEPSHPPLCSACLKPWTISSSINTSFPLLSSCSFLVCWFDATKYSPYKVGVSRRHNPGLEDHTVVFVQKRWLKMSIRKCKSMSLPLLRTQSSPEPLFFSSAAWTFSFSQDVLPHLSLSLLKEEPLYPPPTSAPAKRKWKNIQLSPTHGLSAGHIRDLPKDLFIQYYILLSFPIIYLIVRYLTQILMSEETHQNTVSVERERLHII